MKVETIFRLTRLEIRAFGRPSILHYTYVYYCLHIFSRARREAHAPALGGARARENPSREAGALPKFSDCRIWPDQMAE